MCNRTSKISKAVFGLLCGLVLGSSFASGSSFPPADFASYEQGFPSVKGIRGCYKIESSKPLPVEWRKVSFIDSQTVCDDRCQSYAVLFDGNDKLLGMVETEALEDNAAIFPYLKFTSRAPVENEQILMLLMHKTVGSSIESLIVGLMDTSASEAVVLKRCDVDPLRAQ